jgi:hypothetical protein
MSRQAGIDAPGALQHNLIRGIERKVIFKNNTDRDGLHRSVWKFAPRNGNGLLNVGFYEPSSTLTRFERVSLNPCRRCEPIPEEYEQCIA